MSKKLVVDALNSIKKLSIERLVIKLNDCEAQRITNRIERLFEHSVVGGKCKRSQLLIDACKVLGKNQGHFEMQPVIDTAACLELMQSFFIIVDDIMDEGEIRRGKPCWHRMPEVGVSAINDSLLLDCIVPYVLRENKVPFSIKDAFDEAKRVAVIGQMLDGISNGIEDCTWARHEQLVEHKTSHYTYFTPIQIAALFTGQKVIIPKAKQICYKLGYLFQSLDDYMDCFGNPLETGKIGTDLREAKCTWLTCKAVEKLKDKPDVMKEFTKNFGNPNPSSAERLKIILDELEIGADFIQFRAAFAESISKDIDRFPMIDLRSVFRRLLADLVEGEKNEEQKVMA